MAVPLRFANTETATNPEGSGSVGIQLGGACARMGESVTESGSYYVYEGKIYIFGSPACYKAFKENPAKYLTTPVVWKPTAADLQAGSERLSQVRTAMGLDE